MTGAVVQLLLSAVAIFGAAAIGWVARGERERQLHVRAVRRQRAVTGSREVPARVGTRPARVSRAVLDRGKVVAEEEL